MVKYSANRVSSRGVKQAPEKKQTKIKSILSNKRSKTVVIPCATPVLTGDKTGFDKVIKWLKKLF